MRCDFTATIILSMRGEQSLRFFRQPILSFRGHAKSPFFVDSFFFESSKLRFIAALLLFVAIPVPEPFL